MKIPTEFPFGLVPRRSRRRPMAVTTLFFVGVLSLLTAGAGLAVTPDTVTVTTEVKNDTNGADTSPFDLGTIVHDFVTVLTTGGSDIPANSSVDFSFYTDGDCTTGTLSPPVENVGFGGAPLSPPVSANSSPRGPLPAGDYAYQVDFNSGLSTSVADGTSDCEPFSVEKAATTTVTEVQNSANEPITVIDVFGGAVHDSATTTSTNNSFPITGTVTYSFWTNFTCDGTATSTETVAVNTDSSPQTLGAGLFSYQATYNGDDNFLASTSDCEPFTVMPTIKSGSCGFDKDSEVDGQQFRIILTPIPTTPNYRLSATNPGEFYYNALATGDPGEDFTVSITFPYPFVTKGSDPTHMFDGVNFHQADGKWCASPSGDSLGSDPDQILLSGYTDYNDTQTLEVNGTFDDTGLAYLRVHMDFALKGTLPWTKGASNTATAIAPNPAAGLVITSPDTWTFADSTGGGADLGSVNVFKRDPAIGGLVLDQYGNPLVNVQVKIYDSKLVLKATVYTDVDGWYQWNMKFSGKTTTWTVKVPAYGLTQTFTGPSKTFYVVSFTATV
jgi:hypothetical protein